MAALSVARLSNSARLSSASNGSGASRLSSSRRSSNSCAVAVGNSRVRHATSVAAAIEATVEHSGYGLAAKKGLMHEKAYQGGQTIHVRFKCWYDVDSKRA